MRGLCRCRQEADSSRDSAALRNDNFYSAEFVGVVEQVDDDESHMDKLSRLGRLVFAIAMVGFGIQYLVYVLAAGPAPGPPWMARHSVWAYVITLVLVVAGICLAAGKQITCAALTLAAALLVRALLVFAPRIAANPHDPGPWTSGFEILAMCGAALVIAGTLAGLGRILFASLLVVVGVQHFYYAKFVATLVPSWIPAHLFWAYFVGVAFFAAAIAIALRQQMRLAASLLGLMFLLWVIGLHAPRVFAALHNGNEWTSALVALAMCGGSWVIAGTAKR